MQKKQAKAGEVYAYFIKRLKKYCAYQIISVDKESICYLSLDYLSPELPKTDSLDSLQPYHLDSFCHHHGIEKSLIANTPVPRDYIYIGTCNLKSNNKCSGYTAVWPKGNSFIREERWKKFDKDTIHAYKKYVNSGDFVNLHGQMFKKNIHILKDNLYVNLTEKDTLDLFPCITSASVTGYSKKLEHWLCESPLLTTIYLKEAGVEILDLSKSHLDHLELNVTGVTTLKLPSSVEWLKIYGDINEDLQIDDSCCKENIDFVMVLDNTPIKRYGLKNVKIDSLLLGNCNVLDMALIVKFFPEIEELIMYGNPGNIINFQAIENLHNLSIITCTNLFGYTASDMESLQKLPNLSELDFDSIPKEAGTYLKKYLKNKLDKISVTRLRDNNWLQENLHNPLRHWDGSEFVPKAAYKSAIKCYKETRRKLLLDNTKTQIEETVKKYTQHFNALNEKYNEFIETEEREDIFLVMEQLYEECILHSASETMDEKNVIISLEEIWNIMDNEREDW